MAEATPIAASVAIPRSYYISQIKGGDPSAKDPDPGAIDARVAQENAAIQETVRSLLGLTDASAVTVRMFVDTAPDWSVAGAASGEGGALPSR